MLNGLKHGETVKFSYRFAPRKGNGKQRTKERSEEERKMTGIWLVLLKTEVLFFAIGAVVVLIAGIVNIALEYRERKQNAAEPEEKKDILETAITEETERGIITKCSASNRCAAVTGILELEREREQLREEYDELRERYKILCLAYEGKEEALESLEEDYRELEETNNKLKEEREREKR